MLQAVVLMASPVVSLTCAFGACIVNGQWWMVNKTAQVFTIPSLFTSTSVRRNRSL